MSLLLIGLAVGAGWVVLCLVSPMRKGTSRADLAAGRMYPRPGAVTVARWRRLVLEELRERRQR